MNEEIPASVTFTHNESDETIDISLQVNRGAAKGAVEAESKQAAIKSGTLTENELINNWSITDVSRDYDNLKKQVNERIRCISDREIEGLKRKIVGPSTTLTIGGENNTIPATVVVPKTVANDFEKWIASYVSGTDVIVATDESLRGITDEERAEHLLEELIDVLVKHGDMSLVIEEYATNPEAHTELVENGMSYLSQH